MLKEAAPGMIDIIHGDVMSYNMEKLFSEDKRKDWHDVTPQLLLIGNLPFNIATGLIIKWLRAISEK